MYGALSWETVITAPKLEILLIILIRRMEQSWHKNGEITLFYKLNKKEKRWKTELFDPQYVL